MSLRSRESSSQYIHKNRTKILGGPSEEPDSPRFWLGSHREVLA